MENLPDKLDRKENEPSGHTIPERDAPSQALFKAALIGGGSACRDFLALADNNGLQQLNMVIGGVADPDPEAPGIVLAREMGLFTSLDYTELYSLPGLTLLIAFTENREVCERVIQSKPDHVGFIDHLGAGLLWNLIGVSKKTLREKEESENALQREKQWSQRFIDSLADKILVLDRDLIILKVNKVFLEACGSSESAVLGKQCCEIVNRNESHCGEKDRDCHFEKVFTTGEKYAAVHEYKDGDGNLICEEIAAWPVFDETGELVQVIEQIRDTTSRVCLENELRDSEHKLRLFLESARDLICIKDLEGRYLYLNPAASDLMETPRGEIPGKNDHELFPEPLARVITEHDSEMLALGKTMFFYERMRVNDHVRHYHTLRFPILNDSGEMISFAIVSRDMTESVTLLDEVRQHKEYMENILANSLDMIVTTDLEGKTVTFNPAAERMLGYRQDEIVGTNIEGLWKHPDKRRKLMEEVSLKGSVSNFPAILTARDGHEVEVSLSISELRDSDGYLLGTVGISKDVTEENLLRRRLLKHEEELTAATEFLNKIIQSSPNAVIAADMQGNIIIWNKAAEDALGYIAEDVVGKMNIEKIYPKGLARRVMKLMRSPDCDEAGILRSYPMIYVRQDGRTVEGSLSSAIIYDGNGVEAASVGIFVHLAEKTPV